MRTIFVLLALVATAAAFADVVVTREPQSVALHDALGKAVAGVPRTATVDACEAQALALFGATALAELDYRCVQVTGLKLRRNCVGVPKPALTTFTVSDPSGVIYRGPYCAPGEKCDLPAGWELERNVTVFTDAGGLRVLENGDTEELLLVFTDKYPACWEWQWKPQGEPAKIADYIGDELSTPVEPGGMDGNGLGVNDPPWWPYNGGSGAKP